MFSNFCVLEKPKKFFEFPEKVAEMAQHKSSSPHQASVHPASSPRQARSVFLKLAIFDPNPYLTRKNASNPYLTRPLSASVAEIPTLYGML